jgi:pSer/pThr/pTyr-binding forkhead associated (FHA) protein
MKMNVMPKAIKTKEIKVKKPEYALRVSSGLTQGALVPLSKKKNILGRSFRACLPLEDERVSREHAQILMNEGKFFLSDMGSTNGTFLNNEEVKGEIEVKSGDVIRIGNSIFRLETMKSKDPSFQQKWRSATSVIQRAHFSFDELAKIKPNKRLMFKRNIKMLSQLMGHIKSVAFKELELGLIRVEILLTKGIFKFQKVLTRLGTIK